jgi:hypothetical protein
MVGARAVLVVALLGLASACGPGSSPVVLVGGPPQIHGRLQGIGGPAGSDPRHWSGTVTLTAEDGSARTVHTDAHGRFDVAVVAGHYTLTGHSPWYGDGRYLCHGVRTIVIHDHQTAHVNVLCQMK